MNSTSVSIGSLAIMGAALAGVYALTLAPTARKRSIFFTAAVGAAGGAITGWAVGR